MKVAEIVTAACLKCGLVDSFNAPEIPADYMERGRILLELDVIPDIQQDRTIDKTLDARRFKVPSDGVVKLRGLSEEQERTMAILGVSDYTAEQLRDFTHFRSAWNDSVAKLSPGAASRDYIVTKPTGEPVLCGVWSSDGILFTGLSATYHGGHGTPDQGTETDINCPYIPQEVLSVLSSMNKVKFIYLDRKEYEEADPIAGPYYFTFVETDTGLDILLPKVHPNEITAILPVPIYVEHRDDGTFGELVAPKRYRKHLVNLLAAELADEYGLSTQPRMEQRATKSYNSIKKNTVHRPNKQIPSKKIAKLLGRANNGRVYG